jgi:hypothetical protein
LSEDFKRDGGNIGVCHPCEAAFRHTERLACDVPLTSRSLVCRTAIRRLVWKRSSQILESLVLSAFGLALGMTTSLHVA